MLVSKSIIFHMKCDPKFLKLVNKQRSQYLSFDVAAVTLKVVTTNTYYLVFSNVRKFFRSPLVSISLAQLAIQFIFPELFSNGDLSAALAILV